MHPGRIAVIASLAAASIAGLVWIGAALAGDPAPTPVDAQPSAADIALQAGRHLRIDGPHGPVHVWIPASYHADTGATILYLHGYYDNVDTAWTGHQIPQQFALSALNAMFIAPEAPVSNRAPVNYPDLGELLRVVEDATGVPRGAALTVAIGHSGAFRTLESWMDEPLLDELVLVDSMYGDEDMIVNWYKASPRRRILMVGDDTILGTESIITKLGDAVTIDRVPPSYDLFPKEAKSARLVYMRAQFTHMELVMAGIVLPSLLRLLPVEHLADAPWQLPLTPLAPVPDAAMLSDDAGSGSALSPVVAPAE
ncbi:MAG TPA: hypothetical protein VGM90_19740 [Kofleriaceae bacterium]